jgi:hypothetical protein
MNTDLGVSTMPAPDNLLLCPYQGVVPAMCKVCITQHCSTDFEPEFNLIDDSRVNAPKCPNPVCADPHHVMRLVDIVYETGAHVNPEHEFYCPLCDHSFDIK